MTSFQVQCFLAVAESLSFTEAASRLFVAQSSLSRNVSNLEDELGLKLFVRTKKYVRLTPAGAIMLEEFSRLRQYFHAATQRAMQAQADLNGTLRIGIVENQRSESFLPRTVSSLRQSQPNLKLHLSRGNFRELRESLLANEIDIAITIDFDADDYQGQNVVTQPFFSSHGRCVISRFHPLANKTAIKIDDLKEVPLVAISPDISRGGYEHILELCRMHGFTPPEIHHAESVDSLILMVESGIGYSVLDENSIITGSSAVRAIPINDQGPLSLVAIWHKDNLNPAISHFVNRLMEAEGD